MVKNFACYLLLTVLFFKSQSQSIDSLLVLYSSSFQQEKIHLHTDKETYLPRETIWLKAYVLADDQPSTISTNLYLDLLDAKGNILQHKTMPIIGSTADSYFKIPDTAQAKYTIQAYTTWMLNFDTAFIYHKTITVINNATTENTVTIPTVSLQFFAEGGNMINGLYNYIAYKATQNNGLPYDIKAAIKNSKGEFIDSIESVHDGMGILKFTPDAGETYTAEWKDNKGGYRRTALPSAQTSGIVLHTEQVKDELYYLITMPALSSNLEELTVLATINQKAVYTAKLKPKQLTINQKIATKNFETGVLQITVFDKSNHPQAERIIFINNNNYTFITSLNVKESSIAKRGKNSIEIEIPDTLSSNLSIAVYDANIEQQEPQANIYTDLLLQGDIKGYVHNAAWYFENNTAEAKKYLDLVMQTNGWRRYNWDDIITQKMQQQKYPGDNYLSIYGKTSDAKQEGKGGIPVTLIVQTTDSAKNWYMPISGKDGTFTQSGLIFYDTATVFYKVNNTKDKTTGVGFAKDYNGLVNDKLQMAIPQWLNLNNTATANTTATNIYTQTFITELKNKNPGFEQNAKVLSEVVVKNGGWHNWRNDPILKMDEKYTTMFRGIRSNTWSFDVLHDSMAWAKLDIYKYMYGKVPMLNTQYYGATKLLIMGQPMVPPNPIVIFVNEVKVENDYLATISLEDIAYIKFYGTTPWLKGLGASINIYLKKGDEWKEGIKTMPSNLSKLKVAGYSPQKEFYSPDYSVPDAKHSNADLRTTLYWQPYIITDKENKKATINFYNNDITTKLKVVVEGMNEDGKLVYAEKIIE